MRFVVKLLLAFGVLVGVQGHAFAFVHIDVDLSAQSMHVRSDAGDYDWAISSGRDGHRTPNGVFRPQALYAMVHSAKYNNAPMPHSIFFYGQYAIHGTNAVGALGSPASHGCIRLSPAHAAELFALVRAEGAQIRIVGSLDGYYARNGHHASGTAFAYAPVHHSRTLNQWAHNPLAR